MNLTEFYLQTVKESLRLGKKERRWVAGETNLVPTFTPPPFLYYLLTKRRQGEVWRKYYAGCESLYKQDSKDFVYYPTVSNPCLGVIERKDGLIRLDYNIAELFPTFCYDLISLAKLFNHQVQFRLRRVHISTCAVTVLVYYGLSQGWKIHATFMRQYEYDRRRRHLKIPIRYRRLDRHLERLEAWDASRSSGH